MTHFKSTPAKSTPADSPEENNPSARKADDRLTPFAIAALDARGRVVKLSALLDDIIAQHAYPDMVGAILADAVSLCALLGSVMKEQGRFQLQTKTDGIISMLVVDFDAPDGLRAMARFDAARLEAFLGAQSAQGAEQAILCEGAASSLSPHDYGALLGKGHLAFTVEPGGAMTRYQGVVALNNETLERAAQTYFRQSEQIPTLVRLAATRNGQRPAQETAHGQAQGWRAGGLMVQFLPDNSARARHRDLDPGDGSSALEDAAHEAHEDEAWREVRALVATLENAELTDACLSGEDILFRLFHERGVAAFEPVHLQARCRCSDARMSAMLRSFSREERKEMVEASGLIRVTCEFCATTRVYAADAF